MNTRDELSHHGIMGQKWGLRRYQYENGTYTQEGLDRRRRQLDEEQLNVKKRNASDAERKKMLDNYKNRHAMTIDELKEQINRLQIEQQYRKLVEAELEPGKSTVKKILVSDIGEVALKKAVETVTPIVVKSAVDSIQKKKKKNNSNP